MVKLGTPSAHFLSFAAVLMVPKLLTFEAPQRARHVWLYSTSLKSNLYGGRWSWPVESEDGSIDFYYYVVLFNCNYTGISDSLLFRLVNELLSCCILEIRSPEFTL